ncbi:transcriptional repressor [Candidatus Latescibacterota bacterium]
MSSQNHFRMTRQREIILQELRKVTTHPSADVIYLMVRKVLPKISIGTVYRNLELLFQKGYVAKIEISGNQMRFDGNPQKHHHISCVECSRIDDVGKDVVKRIEFDSDRICDFNVIGHTLHFKGICKQCSAEKT